MNIWILIDSQEKPVKGVLEYQRKDVIEKSCYWRYGAFHWAATPEPRAKKIWDEMKKEGYKVKKVSL